MLIVMLSPGTSAGTVGSGFRGLVLGIGLLRSGAGRPNKKPPSALRLDGSLGTLIFPG